MFSKDLQTSSSIIKIKHCPLCLLDLPMNAFSSVRAKYCISCKRIKSLKQAQEMSRRQLERVTVKKAKTKGIIRLSDLKKNVQKVVNKWIRERDKEDGCISCGDHNASSYDAGHFIAQGSSGFLRYHEDNLHKQCRNCNFYKHANLLEYRISLVKKIGLEKVTWLEENRHKTHKWTREELEEIVAKYK